MSEQAAISFRDALHVLEEVGDAGPLTALYAADAEVGNVIHPGKFRGPDGAHRFWSEYRATFDTVHSMFHIVIVDETQAALEWETEGRSLEGHPVRYRGVTILETDGSKITRSCAYFDPASLGRQILS